MLFEKSVNKEKFARFILALRQKEPFRKMKIVLDNLSVHTCRYSLKRMAEQRLDPIFTVPWMPEYMPIEYAFSTVKREYKKERLRRILNGEAIVVNMMIENAFARIT